MSDKVPSGGLPHAADSPVGSGLGDLVECENDRFETKMTYEQGSRVPILMTALWITALLSLVAYVAIYEIPDLSRWGAP